MSKTAEEIKKEIISKILEEANGSWKDLAEDGYDEGFKQGITAAPPPASEGEMRQRVTEIIYKNSTDDSECLRIPFEKIHDVIGKIAALATLPTREPEAEIKPFPLMAVDINNKQIVHNGHMITASGIVMNLFNPDSSAINLIDIAHGLAHTCRWNGATKSFYSVAEHCCRMFDVAETKEQKLTALFHDAEEAYWGDIISPLKKILPIEIRNKMEDFRVMIFDKYNIRHIDEYIENLDKKELEWDLENLIKNNNHKGWLPNVAKQEWFRRTRLLDIAD